MSILPHRRHNPDVLTCIANLSNDEVFTPPELANQMLDVLTKRWAEANGGADIWSDPTVRFLDPATKSGVFLREIVQRLVSGLEDSIPVLEERVDHILTRQVFGMGVTQLTALLARRSVYCSKLANGRHSIASSFGDEDGNIWFERTEHEWTGGRRTFITDPLTGKDVLTYTKRSCRFCGAREEELDRGRGLETHAYAFIHADNIKARIAGLFGDSMQFDVIIGNPPYQLNDGGGSGSSASPIYHHFIRQAQELDPRFLVMVVPAKWYSGGKGLNTFRSGMLGDHRIRYLADFPDSRDAFSGVDVAGGVCFFLWDRDNPGTCLAETFSKGEKLSTVRQLDEFATFIRDPRALRVVHKVLEKRGGSFADIVSSRKPFGIESAEEGNARGELYLFASGKDRRIRLDRVPKGHDLINEWKVLVSKTSSEHAGQADTSGRKRVLSRIEVMPPGSVSTESYLVVGPFGSKEETENAAAYLRTRFLRFLVSSILLTQNISKGMFSFVPTVNLSKRPTDEDLFVQFGLSDDEIAYINATIRDMEGE